MHGGNRTNGSNREIMYPTFRVLLIEDSMRVERIRPGGEVLHVHLYDISHLSPYYGPQEAEPGRFRHLRGIGGICVLSVQSLLVNTPYPVHASWQKYRGISVKERNKWVTVTGILMSSCNYTVIITVYRSGSMLIILHAIRGSVYIIMHLQKS